LVYSRNSASAASTEGLHQHNTFQVFAQFSRFLRERFAAQSGVENGPD
jgi:hypothetical protein